ncbi:hypothetical protein R69927_01922 [Paraburkholderia domus]|jgi:hypothetical protein|uniref:DUF4148 domain-containing protein n=1 Tax=Paraburkholderia domus TaxID=2793075 RepID=A0A9N8MS22_9BURK|nr:DUF4148 domain-containing protein [Paraburkholderia domus]MBK5048993.1 DUF4148 domain-containing protein [Burkholderia sp. R-70006]MBK5061296.1 DUF4148 domain-containing protein [Burkholderia sp. R-70199]MBK5086339.1 DUF4148 domain-containing protein [Burkholderia sp. R-69927]MBK5120382.1 DUF4148 domain-containing protein [Burkholderia sp. R-69980]MBK5165824.1 DUF4148 domain-containing protein [Burkholderia sp. R-70211]MBK5179904.1 DUF4148 domain-containing protein [Burkholderia sp. R-6974
MKVRNVLGAGLLTAFLAPLAYADVAGTSSQHQPIQQPQGHAGTLHTIASSGAAPNVNPRSHGKTRAEVRQELLQAQRDGLIPTNDTDYPPSQRTVERNKARFAAFERHYE